MICSFITYDMSLTSILTTSFYLRMHIIVTVRRTIENLFYVNVPNKRKHTSNVLNPKDDMIPIKFHLPNQIQNGGYPKVNDHTIVVDVVVVVVVDDTITSRMLVHKVAVRELEWKRMRPNWMLLLVLPPRLVEEETGVANQVLLILRYHPVVQRGRVREERGVRRCV